MIGEISFRDFRFFSGKQSISFLADLKTKRLLCNCVPLSNKAVLKSLALYGGNNTGKTNLFLLFDIMKQALSGQSRLLINDPAVFGDSPTASFEIVFHDEDMGWLSYSFTYDQGKLAYLHERLAKRSFYKSGKTADKVIFEKDAAAGSFSLFGKDRSDTLGFISTERPLLSVLNLEGDGFRKLKPYKDAVQKEADSIVLVQLYNVPINNTLQSLKQSGPAAKRKNRFIKSFVKAADLSIEDFSYDENMGVPAVEKGGLEKQMEPLDAASRTKEPDPERYHLSTKYRGGKKVPSILYDSFGSKKIEALASYIYDALADGKTLVVDELDNGLHYLLTRSIVSIFNNMENEKGQLFFTAHDLVLADSANLLRKDQIYFTTRTNEGARCVCLKEKTANADGVREGESVLRHYQHGDLVPLPNPDFLDQLVSISEHKEARKERS